MYIHIYMCIYLQGDQQPKDPTKIDLAAASGSIPDCKTRKSRSPHVARSKTMEKRTWSSTFVRLD